jgi:uncharacterized protein YchJ
VIDWPANAEALMRSRYDAFVACDEAWLLATWHPSTRPAEVRFEPGRSGWDWKCAIIK